MIHKYIILKYSLNRDFRFYMWILFHFRKKYMIPLLYSLFKIQFTSHTEIQYFGLHFLAKSDQDSVHLPL